MKTPQHRLPLPGLFSACDDPELRQTERDFLAQMEETSTARLASQSIRGEVLRRVCLHAGRGGGIGPGRLTIEGGMVDGDLDLIGLQLGFGLRFVGTTLDELLLNDTRLLAFEIYGGSAQSIVADRAEIVHDLVLNDGFYCRASIGLRSARIGGDLNLAGAQLATGKAAPKGVGKQVEASALNFDGARIGSRVFLRQATRDGVQIPFRANRPVRGRNARIGGAIFCEWARFERGLDLTRTQVEGDVKLDHASIAEMRTRDRKQPDAKLRLGSMRIAGELSIGDTRFHGPRLELARTQVEGRLGWALRRDPGLPLLTVDLSQARVGYLDDDLERWHSAEVILEGLSLNGVSVKGDKWVDRRKAWLGGQPDDKWSPHPYDQVRAALLESGHESKARDIAIAREEVRGGRGGLDRLAKRAHGAYGLLLAYGYKPFRILWISALIVLALWPAYRTLDTCRLPAAGAQCGQFDAPGSGAPPFHALLFSIDSFLPIDLGQSAWQPSEAGFAYLVAAETVIGWLFAALLLGAVTGILRRD